MLALEDAAAQVAPGRTLLTSDFEGGLRGNSKGVRFAAKLSIDDELLTRRVERKCTPWHIEDKAVLNEFVGVHFDADVCTRNEFVTRKVQRKCTPWPSGSEGLQTKLIDVHFELEVATLGEPLARRIERKATPWQAEVRAASDNEQDSLCSTDDGELNDERHSDAAVDSKEVAMCRCNADVHSKDTPKAMVMCKSRPWYYTPRKEAGEQEKLVKSSTALLCAKRESVLWNSDGTALEELMGREAAEESHESRQEESLDFDLEEYVAQQVRVLKVQDGLCMNGRPTVQESRSIPVNTRYLFETCTWCGKTDGK